MFNLWKERSMNNYQEETLKELLKDVKVRCSRENAEERILATLHIRCQVCSEQMRRYRQDLKVYYHCDNCKPNRVVWVEMPEYLG